MTHKDDDLVVSASYLMGPRRPFRKGETMVPERGESFRAPPLFKYVSLPRLSQILTDLQIRLTQPRFLNDPHELSIMLNAESLQVDFYNHLLKQGVTSDEAAAMAQRNAPELVIRRAELIEEQCNRLGVLSLSANPQNMLMWAHYGNEHRGAIIEFDANLLIIDKPAPDFVQGLFEVQYEKSRIDFLARKLPPWMMLAFKSKPWAYEVEWRLVRSIELLTKKTPVVYVADIPPLAIKRVIFGAQADPAAEAPIYEAIKLRPELSHLKFEKAWFSTSLTEVELTPVEEFGWKILHGEMHFGDRWRLVRQWADLDAMQRSETKDVKAAAIKADREAQARLGNRAQRRRARSAR
jgi:hypothetical protein